VHYQTTLQTTVRKQKAATAVLRGVGFLVSTTPLARGLAQPENVFSASPHAQEQLGSSAIRAALQVL
jgi:hypothetical protein